MDESGSYQKECYTQDGQRVRSSSTMSMHVMMLDANFIHSPNSACSNRADWQSSCAISVKRLSYTPVHYPSKSQHQPPLAATFVQRA
ncbi:hypothetical protein ACFX10_030555 [Malus domestica]